MIEKFKIELNDSQRIYFSGDDLKGNITVHVKVPYDLKCVVIRFVGEAKFRLPEERLYEKMNLKKKRKMLKNTIKKLRRNNKICPAPIPNNKDLKTMSNENQKEKETVKLKKKRQMRFSTETYFDKRDILFGHDYSSYREHLPAGTHCLPFVFTLPANLPSSYVGRHAFIHYYCEALIERWNKPTVSEKVYFTVSEVVDLNHDPRADMSCSVTKNSSCWLLCCPRGSVLVTGRLARQGVVCGQRVPLEADIHNMSNTNIRQSYLSIIQVTSYLNSHGIVMCEDERLVLQLKNGKIPKGEFVIWPENKLRVPPLPPTSKTRTLCKIVIISYKVQIRLKLSMKGDNVTVNLPLIIGNIPFRKDFKTLKFEKEDEFPNRIVFPKSNTQSRLLKELPLYSIVGVPSENPKQSDCTYPLPEHVPKCMLFKFDD